MSDSAPFAGFQAETLAFLRGLKEHNDREWFEAHRAEYETCWKQPAEAFSEALAAALSARIEAPVAPKIFRIHRDTRFAKNKAPYKPHIHILFREVDSGGAGPAWFFGLESERMALGGGVFSFEKDALERFRDRALDEADGGALAERLAAAEADGCRLSDPALKRPARGVAADHPRADLLRRKGLAVWLPNEKPERALQPDVVAQAIDGYARIKPIMDWLRGVG